MMNYGQKLCVLLIGFLLIGCSALEGESTPVPSGQLTQTVNGERFARESFQSKDEWLITLDHVYATFSKVTLHQMSPPYDPSTGEIIFDGVNSSFTMSYENGKSVDLAGVGTAELFVVGIPVGQYNAIEWTMPNSDENGAVRLVGTAERNNETVSFDITLDEEYTYRCGEYSGDERKGIVREGETADMEMTLHLDHIFGDGDEADDATINRYALGFTPLANAAFGGELVTTLSQLETQMPPDQYATLVEAAATLGHVGEGHCYETTYGYTANE